MYLRPVQKKRRTGGIIFRIGTAFKGGCKQMIWAKEETLPRAEIERIQLEKLRQTVAYIYERVEPYQKKMDKAGVKPGDIRTLDDLKKLPFTYKSEFKDNYPFGLFAVDQKDLVRYHASSGTTGKPTVVGYT